jgi:hypothetical protein
VHATDVMVNAGDFTGIEEPPTQGQFLTLINSGGAVESGYRHETQRESGRSYSV